MLPEAQYHAAQSQPPQVVETPEAVSGVRGFFRNIRGLYHSIADPAQGTLADQCIQLEDALKRTQSDYMHVSRDYQQSRRLTTMLDDKLHQERVKAAELSRQLESYKKECEDLRKWGNGIQSQNEEFRTHIVDLETGLGPSHEEDYYRSQFERLKLLIESDIVRYSRGNARQVLSDEAQKDILDILSKTGEEAAKSAQFLGGEQYPLPVLYSSNRWRHALIRHIVSLFLFPKVFDGFAFGVSQEFSKSLQLVEQDILSRGT